MAKISTDSDKIQHFLSRGVANIYPNKSYLEKALKTGKQFSRHAEETSTSLLPISNSDTLHHLS